VVLKENPGRLARRVELDDDGSAVGLAAVYEDRSDGRLYNLALEQPFCNAEILFRSRTTI